VGGTEDTKKSHYPRGVILGIFLGVLLALAAVFIFEQVKDSSNILSSSSNAFKIPGTVFEIETGVKVIVKFEELEAGTKKVSLGPHKATLIVKKACQNPGLWMRFEGDALVPILLREGGTIWDGSFTLPVEGNFSLVAYWHGCDGSGELQRRTILTTVVAQDIAMIDSRTQSLFPSAAWISSKTFTQAEDIISQPYVLHNPQIPSTAANLLRTSESVVAKESATFSETIFYQFEDLSNYELVCWIGSDSAELLRSSFLQLRSLVDALQRPFKFHYYESKSFTHPDASWTQETKERFRKCKHILISMDEVQRPTTQTEYIQQVTTFINHLLKAFPDETFPIWMFAVMESPTKPTNCLNPSLPRSSDHPCNTALKELFRVSPFPERVRFLDSTEISLAQLGENPKDMATAIALRIFVFVGKQVAEWRDKGQIGGKKGLQRGAHFEPNSEIVAYTGWENS
jgi:hypothetical protein